MNGDTFHSELLVLLKNAYDDIDRAKQMGWRDFYYALFAIGATAGLYRAVYDVLAFQWMHHILFITPSALMILGIWLVWATQRTLGQRRDLIEHGYKPHLDKRIIEILDGPLAKSVNRGLYPWLYTTVIALTATFITVIMIGLRLSHP